MAYPTDIPPGFRSLCLYNIVYKDRLCLWKQKKDLLSVSGFPTALHYTMWKGFVDACRSDILSPVVPNVLFTLSILFAWCWAKSKELQSFALHSPLSGCTKLQFLYSNNLKSSVPLGNQLLLQVASVWESIIFKVGNNNTGEWVNSGVSWQKKILTILSVQFLTDHLKNPNKTTIKPLQPLPFYFQLTNNSRSILLLPS